jgi:PKD repeat protein
LQLQGGKTYYVQGGQTGELNCGANTFSVSVSIVQPPSNDNFASAVTFTSVPFSDTRDLTAASVQAGEPSACGPSFSKSVWYRFTPSATGAYGGFAVENVAVYTGSSLGTLTNVACAEWPGLYFHANAGTAYYLQLYGDGTRGVNVDVVPDPAADFTYSPTDPSSGNEVVFSYWNGGYIDMTVTGYGWAFGDGATGTGSSASHTFAHAGDYSVKLTVFARGGRSASVTKVVHVT